ncbi:MAG: ThuA domain-containing protein [Verrucomicrobia bacterium]|nr:ThuA domain-containing protein [Verrucomicrobiota bacterium]
MRTAALLLAVLVAVTGCAADKKIVLLAGPPSHPPGEHEHNAGVLLFKKCLASVRGITVETHLNGQWPASLDGAAAIVIYSDGGDWHPALQENRLEQLRALMKKGVGFGCIHYACEPTTEKGNKEFIEWIGGCFETFWSVNPHWDANFTTLPSHPVTRGVKGFQLRDEWYFHMRFREGMKGVTPILSAVPPASTMKRPDGPHSGNPAVREAVNRGDAQHLMWVATREGGGRGFGFTGGHFHKNWGHDDFRKVVLNAILWIAHVDVPAGGVQSTVTADEMEENLDEKGGPKPRRNK